MFRTLITKIKEYNSINLVNALVLNFVAVFGFYLFFSNDFLSVLKNVTLTSTFFYTLFFFVYLIQSRDKNKKIKDIKKMFTRKMNNFNGKNEDLLKKQMKEFIVKNNVK